MFQAVPPPIIRSSNCTYSFWYLSNLAATCIYHDSSRQQQGLVLALWECIEDARTFEYQNFSTSVVIMAFVF
jgi:hypothetical protein